MLSFLKKCSYLSRATMPRDFRRIIRGYLKIRKSGDFDRVRCIKRTLADVEIRGIDAEVSRHFFGAAGEHAATIIKQYAFTYFGGIPFNEALLKSISSGRPVVYPLPKLFQSVLVKNGLTVSRLCSIWWAIYVFGFWVYGTGSVFKHFFLGLARHDLVSLGRYAYFVGLPGNALPQSRKDVQTHDVVTWYAKWEGNISAPGVLCHGVMEAGPTTANGQRVEFADNRFPPLTSRRAVGFLAWGLRAIASSLVDLLCGRWWYALLLKEAAAGAVARVAPPDHLACDYLFPFSDPIYRPLWTYEAEAKGSRITCYFYSTSEQFKTSTGYIRNSAYWNLMTWPLYLVWDRYNEQLIRECVGERPEVRIVGPIWFSDSVVELPAIPEHSLAVFDIQPFRLSGHFAFSTLADMNYTDHKAAMRFMRDIYAAAATCGAAIVHKRKRVHSRRMHKGYNRLIDDLSRSAGFIPVEPDTSPVRVIENCRAVVSMPFTSTAIMARDQGKPSVYYDPFGVLDKGDRGAHGIPLLSGKEELQRWMSSLFGDRVPLQDKAML